MLRLAADLQGKALQEPEGMTLSEIEQAAVDAGLDGALVRRAAAQFDTPRPKTELASRFLGGPTKLVVERVVEGQFPVAQFDRLLEVLRHRVPGLVQWQIVGSMLNYDAARRTSGVQFSASVASRDGATKIRLAIGLETYGKNLHIGLLGGLSWLGLLAGGLGGPLGALGTWALFTGALHVAARYLYAQRVKTEASALQRVADALIEEIERSGPGDATKPKALAA